MADRLPTALFIDFFIRLREIGAQHDRGVVPLITGDLLLQLWFGREVIKACNVEVAFVPVIQQDYWVLPEQNPPHVVEGHDPQVRWDGQSFGAGRKLTAAGYARTLCALAAELEAYPLIRPRLRFSYQRQYRLPPGSTRTALWWQYDRSGHYLASWRCELPPEYLTFSRLEGAFIIELVGMVVERGTGNILAGELPIDVSAPTSYTVGDIATTNVEIIDFHGASIELPTWSPEMFLAHKIAQTVQEHGRRSEPNPNDGGEPLKLYQVNLLLSRCEFERPKLIRCLQAIAQERLITKPQFLAFLQDESRLVARDFSAGDSIVGEEALCEPGVVVQQLVDLVASMVEVLQLDEESLFLQQLNNNEQPEAVWLIYADWLEEQGDARCEFLRKLAAWRLQPDTHSKRIADDLWQGLNTVSTDWLQRVLGGVESYNRQWIEFAAVVSNWK